MFTRLKILRLSIVESFGYWRKRVHRDVTLPAASILNAPLSFLRFMFLKFTSKLQVFPLLAFFIPLAVRVIPEVLVGPFIVGFDTLGYYVPNVLTWLRGGVDFWGFVAVAPFFYVILMGVTVVGVPIVLSLKVLPPLLLGFLGLAVYFYAKKGLSWSPKKSLLVALVATLYFVALRISWDMLRSELALIFLFAALIFLAKGGSSFRSGVLLSLAMLSVVFAHQLVAVVMFFIVLVTVVRLGFDGKMVDVRRLVVSSVPAGLLFLVIVYANYFVSSSFSVLNGFPAQGSAGFMALFGFASYSDMLANTLGFLVFCYLPLLPLVVLGVRRFGSNLQMKAWVVWVFIALFSAVISPNAFVAALPYRWVLLLSFPLAFYAAEALTHFRLSIYRIAVGLMLATLSLGFLVLPNGNPFPYFTLFPYYVPTSALQNTVSSSDCQDTVNALHWLRSNMHGGARLLVHDVFYGWSLLTLNRNQVISYGYGDPEKVAEETVRNGSVYRLYLIWWTNGNGWHGQPVASSVFEEVYESGRIAVYTYDSSVYHNASASEDLRSIKS